MALQGYLAVADFPYPGEVVRASADSRLSVSSLLPGNRSLRYRRPQLSQRSRSGGATEDWLEEAGIGDSDRPPRELPLRMFLKKLIRRRRSEHSVAMNSLQTWLPNHRKLLRHLLTESRNVLSYVEIWKVSLHQIEGHFGTGIRSYFNFLRFLVIMNLCTFLLIAAFVVAPVITSERLREARQTANAVALSTNDTCTHYNPERKGLVSFYDYILDVLSATGLLELSYLFYGFYQTLDIQLQTSTYNLALAYLLTSVFYFLITLSWIVHRAVMGFKRSQLHDDGTLSNYSNTVFAGWDFCITQDSAIQLKHNSLRYRLKMDLEEEAMRQKIAERTVSQRFCIYLTRFVLNLLILAIIIAAFFAIYKAMEFSQASSLDDGLSSLAIQYLPSMVITAANFITPIIFRLLIGFEQYSPVTEIKLTLLRSVFLKLASLGVLLYSLWSQITCDGETSSAENCKQCGYNYNQYQCWETKIGQEMYKLMIFDFLIVVAIMVLVDFPRKMIVQFSRSKAAQLWGEQEFLVPQNVLEIVYGQTVCWIGCFFSPILPLLNTIKYVIIFDLKKLTLFVNCRPSNRTFRTSTSTFFFLVVLLLGFLMACVPFVYSITSIRPSRACGPFRDQASIWDTVPQTVSRFPGTTQSFFNFLGSLAFLVPLFALSSVVLLFLVVRASGYKQTINQLKAQLQQEGRDKKFLVKKIMDLNVCPS